MLCSCCFTFSVRGCGALCCTEDQWSKALQWLGEAKKAEVPLAGNASKINTQSGMLSSSSSNSTNEGYMLQARMKLKSCTEEGHGQKQLNARLITWYFCGLSNGLLLELI